jgi:hypothetical protein
VPDYVRTRDPETVRDAGHVTQKDRQSVVLDSLGLVRLAEPPQVRRDHAEARVGERGDLVTPKVRRVREAV